MCSLLWPLAPTRSCPSSILGPSPFWNVLVVWHTSYSCHLQHQFIRCSTSPSLRRLSCLALRYLLFYLLTQSSLVYPWLFCRLARFLLLMAWWNKGWCVGRAGPRKWLPGRIWHIFVSPSPVLLLGVKQVLKTRGVSAVLHLTRPQEKKPMGQVLGFA